MGNARFFKHTLFEFRHHLFCSLHASGIWERDIHNQVAFVLLGNESRGHQRKQNVGAVQQPAVGQQNRNGKPQGCLHQPGIATREGAKDTVKAAKEPASYKAQKPVEHILLCPFWLEQNGRQGRAEREGIHG